MANVLEHSFASTPIGVNTSRSKFNLSHGVKFTGNVGQIIPFDVMEVMPGDTFEINTSKVCRMQTLLTPVMDNCFLDVMYFFAPSRILWNNWKAMNGEQEDPDWDTLPDFKVPKVSFGNNFGDVIEGSVADYLGLPLGSNISVNAMPFRMYYRIYNEFFRDENLQNSMLVDYGDSNIPARNLPNEGMPLNACKIHDYFTSCLPSPNKFGEVLLPLGESAPVRTSTKHEIAGAQEPLFFKYADGTPASSNGWIGVDSTGYAMKNITSVGSDNKRIYPSNLYTDLSNATASTLNSLYLAYATQRYYQALGRGGSRYVEILRSVWNVSASDKSLQRCEYLGGNRTPLDVSQVLQEAPGTDSPLGHVAGYSFTGNVNGDVFKSFDEHGYIMGLAIVRYKHTYQQGVNRLWSREDLLDFYNPCFANIGEQPVLNKELYAGKTSQATDNKVFGYQEAWAEYRHIPSRVCGEMHSGIDKTLDSWHYADYYKNVPTLSGTWIQETPLNVDRTLAVTSTLADQLLFDFWINCEATRPMPVYSIPGLTGHF